MDEEVKLDTDDRQWACLREAFERLGKSIYIAKWKESNITLSPGRWQLKVAHEEIPFIPDYSIRTTHPEEWQQYSNDWPNDGPIASEENVTQYEDVATRLKEVIWTSKLPIQAITEKGEIEIIPLSVWKDKTKQHRIAFYDSELIRVEETKHWTCWRIYVSEPHLKSLCNDADAQRRASVRKRAAKRGFGVETRGN